MFTASATPNPTRELIASGRICAIGKYVGLGFTPWDGVTGAAHRQHLTSATFASDMAGFSDLNLNYLFYRCTNLASVSGLGNLSGVRSMRYTFLSCAFAMINIRGFNPPTLTDLFYTFSGCLAPRDDLRGLDLGAANERHRGFAVFLLLFYFACRQQRHRAGK